MSEEPKLTVEDREEVEPLENTKMEVTVMLERTFDPNRSRNNLMMTMEAARFSEEDSGENKIIGEVCHGIPVHTVIRDKLTGEDWVLNFGDLFTEYTKARKKLFMPSSEDGPDNEEDVILKVDELDPDNDKVGC